MTPIEHYAIELAASAIESHAEDDLNEEDVLNDEDHEKACDLAMEIANFVRVEYDLVLRLVSKEK